MCTNLASATLLLLLLASLASAQDLRDQVTHGFAQNGEVKLHYATMGEGPLVVMIHGFPDFWYSWRHQMPELAKTHKVVAYDQRGYNESSKPEGQEQYDLSLLVADAAAVITHFGVDKAVVVGHDWGGVVAWSLAAMRPELVEKLVILNLPHPKCLARELATNPEQQKNAAYARAFQVAGAEKMLSSFFLAGIAVPNDAEARPAYIEAFDKSDFTAMLHYYRQNYPREPYTLEAAPPLPNIQAPVLQFHGLKDTALHANGLNGTWEYLDNAWTLVTVPDAGHWVQHDAAALVTKTIVDWLGK
jgi:pimeloyl-ACP methyl ester carboxylesterase